MQFILQLQGQSRIFLFKWIKNTNHSNYYFFLLLVFWSTLTKLKMRMKLNNLISQKSAIKGLIKEMQSSYFKTRKISESDII